jgi:hypothetical protein
MTQVDSNNPSGTDPPKDSFLWKQAWDYFSAHGAQRMTIFNFYIGLSSITATGYFASFKSESNLEPARSIFAFLLCFFAFVFWKLDQRTKAMIKNAECALKYFESLQGHHIHAKVFHHEEAQTNAQRKMMKGWARVKFWRWPMSYSHCFNLVYFTFFSIGIGVLVWNHLRWVQWCWRALLRLA